MPFCDCLYLGMQTCFFPHMFIPVHIRGVHLAVAMETSAPCMLKDFSLDLHGPRCQCMYVTLWLYGHVTCPSISLSANVMMHVYGYPRGPYAFLHTFIFFYVTQHPLVGSSVFPQVCTPVACTHPYETRCSHCSLPRPYASPCVYWDAHL